MKRNTKYSSLARLFIAIQTYHIYYLNWFNLPFEIEFIKLSDSYLEYTNNIYIIYALKHQ